MIKFVTLYVDAVNRTADVHIRRTDDPVCGSRRYRVQAGEPSAVRLGRLLAGQKHTHHPAQIGWGATSLNGRSRDVYMFEADQ